MSFPTVKDNPLEYVLRRFEFAKTNRLSHEEKWDKYYKLWRSYLSEDDYPYSSKLFVPYTFVIIETILPRIIRSLFSTKPYIVAHPRRLEYRDSAEAMTDLLDYCIYADKLFYKMVIWTLSMLIYGTSVAKVSWQDVSLEGEVIERPSLDILDPYEFYPDPYCSSIGVGGDSDYCIMRTMKTREWFLRRADFGNFKNLDKVFESQGSWTLDDSVQRQRRSDIGQTQTIFPDYTSTHEVIELWNNKNIITIVDRQHVIRVDENPIGYQPFIRMIDHPVPHEFYGIGEVEGLENHQHTVNDLSNQFMETSFNISNPMFLVSRLADIDPAQLVMRPSGYIETNDITGVVPLRINPMVLDLLLRAEEKAKSDMERRSGVYDLVRGERTRGEETATEILTRGENANARFGMKTQLHENLVLEMLGEMWGDLLQRFMTQNKQESILREDAVKFIDTSPEMIQGRLLYVPTASSITEAQKMVNRRDLMQIFQVTAPTGILNVKEALLELLSYFPIKNRERFILESSPVMPSGGIEGLPSPTQAEEPPQALTQDMFRNILMKMGGLNG